MARFSARLEATELKPLDSKSLRVRLRVRNTSDRVWPAGGPVFLAYQVLDGKAESLLAEGKRTALEADLPPGGEAEAILDIELPAEQGVYRVLVSPVEEPVAWFYQRGSECLALEVRVDSGGVRASQRRLTAAAGPRRQFTPPALELKAERLLITGACDGFAWTPGKIQLSDGSHVSFWVEGLPPAADVADLRARVDSLELEVEFVAPPRAGTRQVNARVPAGLRPGKYQLRVAVGETASAPFPVTVESGENIDD